MVSGSLLLYLSHSIYNMEKKNSPIMLHNTRYVTCLKFVGDVKSRYIKVHEFSQPKRRVDAT